MLTSLINVSQIPNASGTTGVQLMGNVTNKDGTQTQPIKVAVSGAGVAQLSSGGQSSGSLIAQQQVGDGQSNISFHVDTNLIFSFFFLASLFLVQSTAANGSATSSATATAAKNGRQTEEQTAQQLTLVAPCSGCLPFRLVVFDSRLLLLKRVMIRFPLVIPSPGRRKSRLIVECSLFILKKHVRKKERNN